MTESYKLYQADGTELEFNTGKFYLRGLPSLGNPEIEYSTQTGYFQDGQTITNFFLQPRTITFPFIASDYGVTTREDAWDLRAEILAFLSPLKGPFRFEITLDNHEAYELNQVYPTNGLTMTGSTFNEGRNDGRIDEALRITAFDPVWRKTPINTTGTLTAEAITELSFSIEFPITFGTDGIVIDETITYAGTWRSYPKITITGPTNTVKLTNKLNGALIQYIQPINVGDTVTIDLTDPISGFSIRDASDVNRIRDLNVDSNLTEFYFDPSGTNGIEAIITGDGPQTTVTVEWYDKYLGI